MRGGNLSFYPVPHCVSILPARAGVNLKNSMPNDSCHDSPRMRGGHPHKKIEDVWAKRFTPHARGSTLPDCNSPQQNAILPACAGVNLQRE